MKRAFIVATLSLLTAGVAQAQTPIERTEVGVSIGSVALEQVYEGGGTPQFFGYGELNGRTRLFGWFTLDGWLLAEPALTPGQALTSYTLAARVGFDFQHVGLSLGPAFNFTPGSPSVTQTLPSLTLWAGAGKWRAVLGLFDRPELTSIARLGVEYDTFGLAYVVLYGVELTGRWWLTDQLAVNARLSANFFEYRAGVATVGVTWAPGGRR